MGIFLEFVKRKPGSVVPDFPRILLSAADRRCPMENCPHGLRPTKPGGGPGPADSVTAIGRPLEQPSPRHEPIAHKIGKNGAEARAQYHIGEVVHADQHPTERDPDRYRIEQHPPARPQNGEDRRESEDGGGVTRGDGCVVRLEREKLELELAHRIEQLGPSTPQYILEQGGDEPCPTNADEHKTDRAGDQPIGR